MPSPSEHSTIMAQRTSKRKLEPSLTNRNGKFDDDKVEGESKRSNLGRLDELKETLGYPHLNPFEAQKMDFIKKEKSSIQFRRVHLVMLKALYEGEIRKDGSKRDMFHAISKLLSERNNLVSICSKALRMRDIEKEALEERKRALLSREDQLSSKPGVSPFSTRQSPLPSLNRLYASPLNDTRLQKQSSDPPFNEMDSVSTWNFLTQMVMMQRKQVKDTKSEETKSYEHLIEDINSEMCALRKLLSSDVDEDDTAEINTKIDLWERLQITMVDTLR